MIGGPGPNVSVAVAVVPRPCGCWELIAGRALRAANTTTVKLQIRVTTYCRTSQTFHH